MPQDENAGLFLLHRLYPIHRDIAAQREQCPEKIEIIFDKLIFDKKIGFFAHFDKKGSIYGE